ncbi:hypothetical protein, partial [Ruminococcus sp.]|uniref:hypothetical protein n=1 Tax=Ruminococcus sp. TaxID=41978 RepID=UPI003FEE4E51
RTSCTAVLQEIISRPKVSVLSVESQKSIFSSLCLSQGDFFVQKISPGRNIPSGADTYRFHC